MLKIRTYPTLLVIALVFLLVSSDRTYVINASGFDTAQEVTTNVWHHDCSNLTAFSGIGNESWFADNVTEVSGSMNTTGDFFYSNDTGFGAFSHGPFRYHTLAQPFPVSQFVSLQAELEISSSAYDPFGSVLVYLYDDQLREIVAVRASIFLDEAVLEYRRPQARWRFSNGSLEETPTEQPCWDGSNSIPYPYHETLVLSQNETGLFADIPRSGNFKLLASDAVEMNRTVTYVAVMMYSVFTFHVCELLLVHDIQLTYTTTIETTATSTTPSTTPTESSYPSFDSLLLPALAGFGVIAVLVIWLRKR